MTQTWVVATMKNEGVYVLEWLAYYRLLGFDRFKIYTNDNDDLSVELFTALEALDWFEWHDNSVTEGQKPQWQAYQRALADLNGSGDWALVVDADEFLALRGVDTIQDFLARYPDADAISFYWKMFGTNGLERRDDRLVIERFTHRGASTRGVSTIIKSMVRMNGKWQVLGLHRPRTSARMMAKVAWLSAEGIPMKEGATPTNPFALGAVHHYALKSAEEYRLKQKRGDGFKPTNPRNDKYFRRYDMNEEFDDTLVALAPKVRAEMARIIDALKLRDLVNRIEADYRVRAAAMTPTPQTSQTTAD